MRLNAAELERIHRSLRESCRFWRYAVYVRMTPDDVSRYADAAIVDLGFTVEEYDRVPLLGEPLSDVDQCLARAAGWLERYWTSNSEDEFVFRAVRSATPDAANPPSATRMVISQRHGCVIDSRGEDADWRWDAAAVYIANRLSLHDYRSGKKYSAGGPCVPEFTLKVAAGDREGDQYRGRITFGAGVHPLDEEKDANGNRRLSAEVEPVVLIDCAHRKGAISTVDDGVVTVKSELGVLRAETATGRILGWSFSDHGVDWSIAFRPGEYEKARGEIEDRSAVLTELCEEKAPFNSFAAFAIDSALTQPYVQRWPAAEAMCIRARTLLQNRADDPLVRAIASHWCSSMDKDESGRLKFKIPPYPVNAFDESFLDGLIPIASKNSALLAWSDPGKHGIRQLLATTVQTRTRIIHMGPAIADALFPRGSWPWTLTREAAFYAADDAKPGELYDHRIAVDLVRVVADDQYGPVGLWVTAKIFETLGYTDDTVAGAAKSFLSQWDPSKITNDIHLLTRGDHGLRRLTHAFVKICDDLPDEDRHLLLDSLADPWSGIVKRLMTRRAETPDESPEDAVEAVLLEAWQSGYSDLLKADLRKLVGKSEAPTREIAERASDTAQE